MSLKDNTLIPTNSKEIMATVKIKLAPNVPNEVRFAALINSDTNQVVQIVQTALNDGLYTESKWFEVNGDSEDAAEEVFDLTNNPNRQDEREEKYGNGRSVSVGDVVIVNRVFGEEQWLCLSTGWIELSGLN